MPPRGTGGTRASRRVALAGVIALAALMVIPLPGTPGSPSSSRIPLGEPGGMTDTAARAATTASPRPLGGSDPPVNGVTLLGNIDIGILNGSGTQPAELTYDAADNDIYVPDYGSNNVTIISGTNNTILTSPLTGDDPIAATYDPQDQDVYTANYGITDDLSAYHGTTSLGYIAVGAHPRSMLYDPQNGELYAMVSGADRVSVVSGTSILRQIAVGSSPQFAALDTATGNIYVSNTVGDTVSVISGSTSSVIATIAVGQNPEGVLYDPSNGYIYVSNSGGSNVSVLGGTHVITNLTTGSNPGYAVYDSATECVYLPNSGNDTVSVINGTTILANVSVGAFPRTATYDPANGLVYVTDLASDNVSVINGTRQVALVAGGNGAYAGLYDPSNSEIYVSEFDDSNVSVIGNATSPWFATFRETGLPPGTTWGVAVDATEFVTNGTNVSGYLSNGAYGYSVPPVTGFTATGGTFRVANDDPLVNITFRPDYPVDFNETGLPTYTLWAVTLDGVGGSAAGPSIDFAEPNGTYAYSIDAIPGYSTSWTGSVVVHGGPVTVDVLFTVDEYAVTFEETGLAAGTVWTVTLGASIGFSATSSIGFTESNGTYAYSVTAIPGYTAPPGGDALVQGASVTVPVTFVLVTYPLRFVAEGLPKGTNWTVDLNGSSSTTSGTSLTLTLPNGTYHYAIPAVPGFTTVAGGTVLIDGHGGTVTLRFTKVIVIAEYAVTFTESGLSPGAVWAVRVDNLTLLSANTTVRFDLANGTYLFAVQGPAGEVAQSPPNATVRGAPAGIAVTFSPMLYRVTFEETGLPAYGVVWVVSVSGAGSPAASGGTTAIVTSTANSSGATIVLDVPNGTYAYLASGPNGYSVGPGGAVEVDGQAPAAVVVPFRAVSSSTLLGLPPSEAYALLGVLLAVVGLIAAGLLVGYRPSTEDEEEATAPPEATDPFRDAPARPEPDGEAPPPPDGPAS